MQKQHICVKQFMLHTMHCKKMGDMVYHAYTLDS